MKEKKVFRIRVVLFTTIIVSILLFGVFGFYSAANGVFGFGGMVLGVQDCPCDGALLLKVGPPVPGTYMFKAGVSVPYAYGQLRTGVWTLGTYAPGPQCRIAPPACIPIPTVGMILTVGTSK